MTKKELVECVRRHEVMCRMTSGTAFRIVEVKETAAGILAVLDDEGEWTIYYDKSKYKIAPKSPFEDVGKRIDGFPTNTGFLTNVMARSMTDIVKTAKMSLKPAKGAKVAWHKKPVVVSY